MIISTFDRISIYILKHDNMQNKNIMESYNRGWAQSRSLGKCLGY